MLSDLWDTNCCKIKMSTYHKKQGATYAKR